MFFINLSNHAHHDWDPRQITACVHPCNNAKVLDVYDMPFPHINPSASKEDVDRLADEYLYKITTLIETTVSDQSEWKLIPIHVMGEMSFTFALVKRLQSAGFKCLASTTRRIYVPNPDGSATRRFEFVRFREY